jgi:D-xylose transport system ATP-binding protein
MRGLALLTEDRRRLGLIPGHSIAFNLTLSSLGRLTRYGLLDLAEELRRYRHVESALQVSAKAPTARIDDLSGGNQQKVLLGRVLLTEPRVFLLDEPTRGVDVATKFEIYEWINRLTQEGKAVLLVTSELPELLGLSDRVLILRQGRVTSELMKSELRQERVLAHMMGHDDSYRTDPMIEEEKTQDR